MRHLKVLGVLCGLLMSIVGVADDEVPKFPPAELIWIEHTGGQNRLYTASFDGQDWTSAQELYHSQKPITSPALETNSQGGVLVLWSELRESGTVLLSRYRRSKAHDWENTDVFFDQRSENLAAFIVRDARDRFWVFWSSNDGAYDDVFMRSGRYQSWSALQQVNATNEVPDIRPTARLLEDGNLEVEWQTYSVTERRYVPAVRQFELTGVPLAGVHAADEQSRSKQDDAAPGSIPMAAELSTGAVAWLHFPENRWVRSYRLDQMPALP